MRHLEQFSDNVKAKRFLSNLIHSIHSKVFQKSRQKSVNNFAAKVWFIQNFFLLFSMEVLREEMSLSREDKYRNLSFQIFFDQVQEKYIVCSIIVVSLTKKGADAFAACHSATFPSPSQAPNLLPCRLNRTRLTFAKTPEGRTVWTGCI